MNWHSEMNSAFILYFYNKRCDRFQKKLSHSLSGLFDFKFLRTKAGRSRLSQFLCITDSFQSRSFRKGEYELSSEKSRLLDFSLHSSGLQ